MAENTGGASYKEGVVYDARPGFARVRFDDLDGLVSAWLPLIVKKSYKDKECLTLDVGEQVACLLDEYFESGCVLGAVYSNADAPPVDSADKYCFRFFDGGQIEYDRASGKLTIVAVGDVDVTAGGAVALRSPVGVVIDSPSTTCTGDLLVQNKLTFQGGMSGRGGDGAAVTIEGSIAATGTIMDGAGNSANHSH